MSGKEQMVSEITKVVNQFTGWFEKAAGEYIKLELDCSFNQSMSFGKGKEAHLIITACQQMSPKD